MIFCYEVHDDEGGRYFKLIEAALPGITVMRLFAFEEGRIPVQIAYGETNLGKLARKMGGTWATDVKLWYIQYGKIKGTALEKHIILDASMKNKPSKSI